MPDILERFQKQREYIEQRLREGRTADTPDESSENTATQLEIFGDETSSTDEAEIELQDDEIEMS